MRAFDRSTTPLGPIPSAPTVPDAPTVADARPAAALPVPPQQHMIPTGWQVWPAMTTGTMANGQGRHGHGRQSLHVRGRGHHDSPSAGVVAEVGAREPGRRRCSLPAHGNAPAAHRRLAVVVVPTGPPPKRMGAASAGATSTCAAKSALTPPPPPLVVEPPSRPRAPTATTRTTCASRTSRTTPTSTARQTGQQGKRRRLSKSAGHVPTPTPAPTRTGLTGHES